MTRVVIVGEIYNADLSIGGGPIYPGGSPSHPWVPPSPGSPSHPIYNPAYPAHPIYNPPPGIWGGPPLYPDQGLPGSQPHPSHPIAPGGQPPGIWGGPPLYPDQGLPQPPTGPIAPPAGGTEVPPDVYTPAPIPEEIASQVVVSVYDPRTMTWTTKSYPPR